MVQRKLSSRLGVVVAVAFLGACGGNVTVSSDGGSGGEGGTGGEGGGTTATFSTTGGTGTTGTGGVGGTTGTGGSTGGSGGGTGGSTGGTGGVGGGTGGGPVDCGALPHAACVGAFPSCAPVYDDECCPSCDPMGGCADCINLQFHHCAPLGDHCLGGEPASCGFAPEWACAGKEPTCDQDPGGSPEPCGTQAGCVVVHCATDEDCTQDPVCLPVRADMCGPAICAAAPPPCLPGLSPEVKGGCWSGKCIEPEICLAAP